MPLPAFFIVGAPRCGTSALYAWLRQHPQLFLPGLKEPHHFDTDLEVRGAVRDRGEYLALFDAARPGQRAGEASTGYLYSREAAQGIQAFNPDARILVLLRNPVDLVRALHEYALFAGHEVIEDLERALEAEADRRRGRGVPRGCGYPKALLYRDRVRLAEQVERYLQAFGHARVRIMLQEDLRHRPAATYDATLRFLEADAGFRPEFDRVNPALRARWARLHRLALRLGRSRAWVRARSYVPTLSRLYRRVNLDAAVPPMDARLRQRLLVELTPEIERLGRLIGRDLSAWTRDEEAPA